MLKYIVALPFLVFTLSTIASEGNESETPATGKLFEDQDLSCVVTSDNKRYDDVFVIEVRKNGLSKIKYKRKHLASPAGEYGELEIVRGCYHARQVEDTYEPKAISVECQSGGEEGMASIHSESLKGSLYFYFPKIGYGERTELALECERI